MPRLFTGLELPQAVAEQVAVGRGGVVGARWMDPADYHITLRFIGDVDGRAARDIDEVLAEIRRPAPLVRFEGLGVFGGARPRAIVLRAVPDPALIELQAEQERRMRRIGLEPETRKYTPHVTLARLRGPDSRAVADYLAIRGALAVAPFRPERFVLYSARDSVGGGPYVVETAYPLG
jgi:RNA 2',3'-cyclic 3'-phosphodiesterase